MGSSTVTTRPGKPEGMVVERASGKRAEDGLSLDRVLGTPTKSLCRSFFSLFVVNREVEYCHIFFLINQSILRLGRQPSRFARFSLFSLVSFRC